MYPAVVAAGFLAGFINTLAGNGSVITLPLLIFLGLPANVANGTNRVGILLQTVVSVNRFHKERMMDWRGGLRLAIPASLGAIVGALMAVQLDEDLMRTVIGMFMLLMLVLLFAKPKRWLEGRPESLDGQPGWLKMVSFFAIGAYGGFIQVGVGVFLLAGLVLGVGYSLKESANPVKNLIVLCFTVFALAVFVFHDQVEWAIGLVLATGNMLGAYVAVKVAARRLANFVRWLLIVMVAVAAVKLLGIYDWAMALVSAS